MEAAWPKRPSSIRIAVVVLLVAWAASLYFVHGWGYDRGGQAHAAELQQQHQLQLCEDALARRRQVEGALDQPLIIGATQRSPLTLRGFAKISEGYVIYGEEVKRLLEKIVAIEGDIARYCF